MVSWRDGRVATSDAVEGTSPLAGTQLRDRYWDAVRDLTLGLARRRVNSVVIGPLELLRFGEPKITPTSVEWSIEGGLLAGAPDGHWRLTAERGTVTASLQGYRPRLPRPLYAISQLQVHQLFTRLFLLRLHDQRMQVAPQTDRHQAALVDIAFCLTVARYTPARRRPWLLLGLIAGYHIACWSTSGKTLGGLVVGQRVVAVDGRRLTPAQSVVRLLTIPVSLVLHRPVHDDLAGTEVVPDSPDKGHLPHRQTSG